MSGCLLFCQALLMLAFGPSRRVRIQYIHKHHWLFTFHENTSHARVSAYNNYVFATPERAFVYPYYPPVKS